MSPILLVYFAAVAGLAVFGLHRLHLLWLWWRLRSRRPRLAPGAPLPGITVQLPIYNERYVARRLLLAAARLDYPADRLEIQLLDDSTDDTTAMVAPLVRRLRRLGRDVVHHHRAIRSGFKAGALAEGLAVARGEIVVIFDADFVPPPDFLRRIVGHFEDPAVGMVQARWGHLNRDDSLLTRLQAIFLDGHFFIEHVARNRSGRFFNFNGTAGAWRAAAIREAGGWAGDTLTEDLDLSYRAQMLGWRFVYLDDLHSDAELPRDMNAFKAQQHRWAKGSIQAARKILPSLWRAPLPFKVKLEGSFHLGSNLAYLIMAVPCFLWVPTLHQRFDTDRPWMLAMAGAMTFTTLCMLLYHTACQRAAGRDLRSTLVAMPALLSLGIGLSLNNGRAVVEALGGHQSPFMRTPKQGDRRPSEGFSYALRANWMTWLELAMAAYFAAGFVVAWQAGRYIALPFLLLFLAGFAYVGLASLGRRLDLALRVGSFVACAGILFLAAWLVAGLWPSP